MTFHHPCHPPRRRRELRWLVLFLGVFAYLLLLTWERVEIKERASRLESLERRLQERQTDESLLRVELDRKSGFLEIQRTAQDWGMQVASKRQRFLLAGGSGIAAPAEEEPPRGVFQAASLRIGRMLRGGVAQARPASVEGGHAAPGR